MLFSPLALQGPFSGACPSFGYPPFPVSDVDVCCNASMAAPVLSYILCFKGVRAACTAAVAPAPADTKGRRFDPASL